MRSHFSKSVIKYMLDRKYLKFGKYVCDICVQFCQSELAQEGKKATAEASSVIDSLSSPISQVDNSSPADIVQKCTNSELLEVAKVLGKRIAGSISEDARNITKQQRVPLKPLNEWLHARNPILVTFLRNINESASSVSLVHAINAIYFIAYAHAIMPFSFAVNLIIYFLVRSKQVAQILFRHGPYGSYDSVRDWISRSSHNRLPTPVGDTVVVFDNEQVLGKSWRIHVGNKMKCSVITSVLYLIVDPLSQLQKRLDLSPFNWLPFINSNPCTLKDVTDYEAPFLSAFKSLRLHFITGRLREIYSELKSYTSTTSEAPSFCLDGHSLSNSFMSLDTEHDIYTPAPSNLNPLFSQQLGEPYLDNPNSYERVCEALVQILDDADISRPGFPNRNKQWGVIVCDACPYTLACKLQTSQYTCETCMMQLKKPEIESHLKTCTDSVTSLTFQNIVFMPGLGHEEMNMLKCFNKLIWQPLLQNLADILSFHSNAAQSVLFDVSDHHKSWEASLLYFSAPGMNSSYSM